MPLGIVLKPYRMKLKQIIESPFKEGAKAHLVTRPAWFTIKGNSMRVMHSYYKCEVTGKEFYFGNTWRINNKYLNVPNTRSHTEGIKEVAQIVV